MPRLEAVHPVLGCRDVMRAVRFYERLGFGLAFVDSTERPTYAAITKDTVELHLQWADATQWAPGIDRPAYRFYVSDVDALYQSFRERGAIDADAPGGGPWRAPADTPWATREFHLRDADGNGLHFYRDRPVS